MSNIIDANTGRGNTVIGPSVLTNRGSGNSNTVIGNAAGSNITAGNNNIMIGAYTRAQSATGSSQLNIGNLIYGQAGSIGIDVHAPAARLDVAGGVKVADDTDIASAAKVGTIRYRATSNDSYVEMCMQDGAASYVWVVIETKTW